MDATSDDGRRPAASTGLSIDDDLEVDFTTFESALVRLPRALSTGVPVAEIRVRRGLPLVLPVASDLSVRTSRGAGASSLSDDTERPTNR